MGSSVSKRRTKEKSALSMISTEQPHPNTTKWERDVRRDAAAATLGIYQPPVAGFSVAGQGTSAQVWRIPGKRWEGVGSTDVKDYYVKYPDLLNTGPDGEFSRRMLRVTEGPKNRSDYLYYFRPLGCSDDLEKSRVLSELAKPDMTNLDVTDAINDSTHISASTPLEGDIGQIYTSKTESLLPSNHHQQKLLDRLAAVTAKFESEEAAAMTQMEIVTTKLKMQAAASAGAYDDHDVRQAQKATAKDEAETFKTKAVVVMSEAETAMESPNQNYSSAASPDVTNRVAVEPAQTGVELEEQPLQTAKDMAPEQQKYIKKDREISEFETTEKVAAEAKVDRTAGVVEKNMDDLKTDASQALAEESQNAAIEPMVRKGSAGALTETPTALGLTDGGTSTGVLKHLESPQVDATAMTVTTNITTTDEVDYDTAVMGPKEPEAMSKAIGNASSLSALDVTEA